MIHPSFENITDDEFFNPYGVNNSMVDFYSKIAKTGVRNVIFGGVWVGIKGNKPLARLINKNNYLKIYSDINKTIHRYNCITYLKLKMAYGREVCINNIFDIFRSTATFRRDVFDSRINSIRVSDGKIYNLIDEIVNTAGLASVVGFDGVVIDATNSNLLGELSSREFNKRVFGYFQDDLEALIKLIRTIKYKFKNLNIIVKLSVISLYFYIFKQKNHIKTICSLNKNIKLEERFNDILKLASTGVDGFEFEFGAYENEFIRTLNGFIDVNVFDTF